MAETRFDFFTKRRNQALAIIQLRMKEQKKLKKALYNKPQVQAPNNGPYLGWPAIIPQSRGSILGSTRLNSRGTSLMHKESRASTKREQLILKHTSTQQTRYKNILEKASNYLSPTESKYLPNVKTVSRVITVN